MSDFAYRIPLRPGYFLAGAGLTLLVTFLAVGGQSAKAAAANPAEALRHE